MNRLGIIDPLLSFLRLVNVIDVSAHVISHSSFLISPIDRLYKRTVEECRRIQLAL